jgi:hypothetical protein
MNERIGSITMPSLCGSPGPIQLLADEEELACCCGRNYDRGAEDELDADWGEPVILHSPVMEHARSRRWTGPFIPGRLSDVGEPTGWFALGL